MTPNATANNTSDWGILSLVLVDKGLADMLVTPRTTFEFSVSLTWIVADDARVSVKKDPTFQSIPVHTTKA
jgi:hypothetical protein